jgi:hypothetical protein
MQKTRTNKTLPGNPVPRMRGINCVDDHCFFVGTGKDKVILITSNLCKYKVNSEDSADSDACTAIIYGLARIDLKIRMPRLDRVLSTGFS